MTIVKAYRIRDWAKLYENNRTRELVYMEWVPIPNKHDGDGFSDLLDHPEGTAHFGAWVLMVQVASKCSPRGVLVRRLGDRIVPHDERSLARVTHSSVAVFATALERLLQIGWLEVVESEENKAGDAPHDPAPACGEVPSTTADDRTTLTIGNGTETERNGSGSGGTAPRRDAPTAAEIIDDPEARWSYVRREPWARAIAAVVGSKIAKANWPAWKRIVALHGQPLILASANALRPHDRWPENVESHAREHAPPPPEPIDPLTDATTTAVRSHGWERCFRLAGFDDAQVSRVIAEATDEAIAPEAKALEVLTLENRPAARVMLAKLGGAAASGAA